MPSRRLLCRLTRVLCQRKRLESSSYSTSTSAPVSSPASAIGSTDRKQPRILSGIQPTGIPHIGNYLGALRQWVDLQPQSAPSSDKHGSPTDDGKNLSVPFFSVVDLHAVTVPQDPKQLRIWRKESMAALLAIGLDPLAGRCHLFYQSDVPAHSELMWILSTIASTGYLSRMTQWKSKLDLAEDESLNSEATKAKLKLGLFSYPVLQAADILLYMATAVPVGEDQKQHLEFARTLAGSFNHTYGEVFPLPDPMILPTSRVLSLRPDPSSTTPTPPSSPSVNPLRLPKMSKSHPHASSRILVTDSPQEIRSKFRSALTDSDTSSITYDPSHRPGVSNLISIYATTRRDPRPFSEIASDFNNTITNDTNKMKSLKDAVADAVIDSLAGVSDRYNHLLCTKNGRDTIREVVEHGKKKARGEAEKTMGVVREVMGLS